MQVCVRVRVRVRLRMCVRIYVYITKLCGDPQELTTNRSPPRRHWQAKKKINIVLRACVS